MLYNTPIDKKQIFEWFDEYMEQRDKLKQDSYLIQCLNKVEQEKAFCILLKMNFTFKGIKGNKFVINGFQKKALDKVKIKYGIL